MPGVRPELCLVIFRIEAAAGHGVQHCLHLGGGAQGIEVPVGEWLQAEVSLIGILWSTSTSTSTAT
jgi:hypothetical protein